MSDGLSKHIGALTMGTDAGKEAPGDDTMDGGDQTIEEIPSVEERAVPDTVVDEQAEQFAKTSRGDGDQADGGEDGEDTADYKALYEAEQKSSAGRLGDLRNVRAELSQTKQGIDQLRQAWLAREEAEAERLAEEERAAELDEERRIYGDEVVDDPGVSYMRDKMVQTQDMIDRQAADQEEYRQKIQEEASQIKAAQDRWVQTQNAVRVQEESFSEKNPDYGDAYTFAREKRKAMYQARGYTADQAEVYIDQEEEGIRQEQLSRPGGSVPQAVYEIAKMFGWTPEMSRASDDGPQDRPVGDPPGSTVPNFAKLRSGIGSQGSGRMRGSTGSHDGSRAVSAEEFFNTVSFEKRLEILSDPDKFEELGRTGQILLD